MANYKILYHKLFNKISDVIDELQMVQQQAEELYITTQSTDVSVLDFEKPEE